MIKHHTKNKGDLGVAKVVARLIELDLMVLQPFTEHAPFDLVVYDGAQFDRIQVKYRSVNKAGTLFVNCNQSWADRNGTHVQPWDKDQIDIVAIYCPETDEVYFIRIDSVGSSITLRVNPSRNNQSHGVVWASDHKDYP